MKESKKKQVTQAVSAWIESSPNRSATKLASVADVSTAHVSRIRNGEFSIKVGERDSPISDSVFNKLIDALGMDIQSANHWDTYNYTLVTKVCGSAQQKAQRILMDGPTGLGKTYSLERYALTHDKVLYVKVTGSMSSKDMLEEICKKLHVRMELRGNRQRMNVIQKRVTATPGWLIIIDEAEYLRNQLFGLVKEIADFTERRSGMILSGMDLEPRINTLADRHKAGFPQLRRRFFPNRVHLRDMQSSEIQQYALEAGVSDKTAINVLTRTVFDYDALGQYLTVLSDIQEKTGELVTGQEVIDIFNPNY